MKAVAAIAKVAPVPVPAPMVEENLRPAIKGFVIGSYFNEEGSICRAVICSWLLRLWGKQLVRKGKQFPSILITAAERTYNASYRGFLCPNELPNHLLGRDIRNARFRPASAYCSYVTVVPYILLSISSI
ncbi:hypothetical protein [Paenibacillus mucilaginosus]|uniref:hypothetical protein n=1 Tax=Paenibacillus mucilaginosus TaxID=61624 RepID=UPI003D1C725C